MSVVVGTLTIDLRANTASFAQSMDKMSQLSARTSNDIKRSLEKIAAVGLAMGAAIAGGTAEMIKKSVEAADAMGKLAQKTGTTAETLSVLSYAAKLADLDTETLGKGLEKLSQAMFKAQNGNVQMQRIFDRLGVSTKDANGHLKDSGIVMEDLAVKFSKMADGSGKTALAMAIFGRGGAAMIPMLNELGEKQAEINEEAHRFGLVLSTSTTQVAAEANDKLKKLGSMFTGLGYSLMSATLPALNELTDKLMDIARSSELQGLTRAFGGEVVKAVHLLGDTLDFAVKHAHALKLALEAIAAVKIASIAIPIVADLAGGGLLNVGKGIDKATLGMLGFERAAKVLPKIGEGISGVASGFYGAAKGASLAEIASVGLETGFGRVGKALTSLSFASVFTSMTSGIGKALTAMKALSAASVFAGLTSALRAIPALFGAIATGALNASKALMLAALSNPWTAAALAITALVALLYKFRNATFSVGGSTYELRDTWNAAWIIMKNTVGVVVDWFKKKMDDIKDAWSGVVTWIKNNPIANALDDSLGIGTDWGARFSKWVGSKLGVPDFAKKALDEAKRQRLAAEAGTATDSSDKTQTTTTKSGANTAGLGKPQKDPYGEEINKLNLAIAAQRSYLSVLDGTPDAIQAVTIAEKANSIALEVNKKLLEEFGHKMTAKQEAELKNAVATEESLKSLVSYGKELVSQQHSAELHIQQTRAMAAANLEGDAAMRQAAIDNAILALRYEKTAEELKKLTEMEPQLRAVFAAQADADLLGNANRDIFALRQEAGAQDILHGAILGTIEAQRRAEIQARTYALSQQIDATSAGEARLALIEERSAIEDNMRAQQQAADLAEARRTLGGPLDEYTRDKEHLQDLVVALQDAQDGALTYEQELAATSAEQDIFDKAIDRTVQEMLRFGDARDGVDAFFLDMQKEAQSTASIIYEALHSAFDKISDNLAELVTGGKTSFAKMFQDIGKQIVQSEIKQQLQEGLGKLAGKFGITIPGLAAKLDGSSESRALWVRTAGADGFAQPRTTNELTDLIGPNPQESGDQTTRSIGSILASWFGHKQKSPFGESLGMPEGNELTDLFASTTDMGGGGFGGDESAMDLPTDEGIGDGEGGGVLSAITGVIGGLKSGMQSQQGAPKGTASSPFYVKTVGGSGGSPLSGMGGLGSLLGGGGSGGFGGDESIMDQPTDEGIGGGGFFSGLLSKLSGLFSGGGSSGESGGLSSIFSMFGGLLIPHAAGGPVSPSSAYLVGEQGPEILTGVSGSIMSNTNSMRALSGSGGSSVSYSIDARGTDPAQTEQRVQRAIRAAHNSAINTAVQASAERLKRVPHRY